MFGSAHYKQNIDTRADPGDSNGVVHASSHLNGFLSHNNGKKRAGRGTKTSIRPGKHAARTKAAANNGAKPGLDGENGRHSPASRPSVLERRRNAHLPARAETQIQELQALAKSLLEMREIEHQDISRELHDNIAQVLSAATARISLARQEPIPAWLRQELLDLRDQLKGALAEVRTLARELRPSLLDHLGFAAALAKHAEAFRERTRMTLDVAVMPEAAGFLGNGDLTHLFRLTQEALQNIEEHSGATNAWIHLRQSDGGMILEIGDDGNSFTPERIIEAQQDGHLGLLGMRERAELLGGKFILQAVPGQGTVISVTIPPHTHTNKNKPRRQNP